MKDVTAAAAVWLGCCSCSAKFYNMFLHQLCVEKQQSAAVALENPLSSLLRCDNFIINIIIKGGG